MKNTPAYQLFHRHFAVRIPNLFCYSLAQIEQFGRPTTGNKLIDDELDKAPRDMLLTPVAIMTYYEEGSPVWFESREDVSTMYKLIIEHLNNWNYLLSIHIDLDHPPAEDFVRLDSFAESIFPLTLFTKDKPMQLGLRAKLSGFGISQNFSTSRLKRLLSAPDEKPNNGRLKHESCILALINRIDSLSGGL
jgi:hypothetical protein